jgi:cell division septum initiation protein DivIVA
MSTIESVDELDREEVDEYIDLLHDRIQFLEEELQDAERTILEMRQEGVETSLASFLQAEREDSSNEPGEDFETDIRNVSRYVHYLTTKFDVDKDTLEQVHGDMVESIKRNIDDKSDLNHASLALWVILIKHEEMARGD